LAILISIYSINISNKNNDNSKNNDNNIIKNNYTGGGLLGYLNKGEGEYLQSKSILLTNNKKDNVFFVLEKLSDSNIDFWDKYIESPQEESPQEESQEENNFKTTLELFRRLPKDSPTSYDMLIAYITIKDPNIEIIEHSDIEISVIIITKENIPIMSLIGYCYSLQYDKLLRHKDVYLHLTMFVSSAIRFKYPSVLYIVTKFAPNIQHELCQFVQQIKTDLFILENEFSFNNSISYLPTIGSIRDRIISNPHISSTFFPVDSIELKSLFESEIPIDDSTPTWKIVTTDIVPYIDEKSTPQQVIEIECPSWILNNGNNTFHPYLEYNYEATDSVLLQPITIIDIKLLKLKWDTNYSQIKQFSKDEREGYFQIKVIQDESSKRHNFVFFTFEKLGKHNLPFWTIYANKNNITSTLFDCRGNEIYMKRAVPAFLSTLSLFTQMQKHIADSTKNPRRLKPISENVYDVWIASSHQSNPIEFIDMSTIDMTFSVAAKNGIPITSHMGIFKNSNFLFTKKQPTNITCQFKTYNNISSILHVFAIAAAKIQYPEIKYLMTKPVPVMSSILLHLIPKDSVWVGTNRERYRMFNELKEHIFNQEKFVLSEEDLRLITLNANLEQDSKEYRDCDRHYITGSDYINLLRILEKNKLINKKIEEKYLDKKELKLLYSTRYSEWERSFLNLFTPPILLGEHFDIDNDNYLNLGVVPIDDTHIKWTLITKDKNIEEFTCPGWYLGNYLKRNNIGMNCEQNPVFPHLDVYNLYVFDELFYGESNLSIIIDVDIASIASTII
jgi:uncharacterized membrane protein